MLHHEVLQGSRKLQVWGSKRNSNVYNGSRADGRSTGYEGSCFCFNMLMELGFRKEFENRPLHVENTATLHFIGNCVYSSRTKHVALRFFYIRNVDEDETTIHYISMKDQLADIGTKHLNKHRLQQLPHKMQNV